MQQRSKSKTPQLIYSTLIAEYKSNLKTNKFALELAKKYHKTNHKPAKSAAPVKRVEHSVGKWPVESPVFTQVLRKKLQGASPMNFTRELKGTRLKLANIRRTLKSSHDKQRAVSKESRQNYSIADIRTEDMPTLTHTCYFEEVPKKNIEKLQLKIQECSKNSLSSGLLESPEPTDSRPIKSPRYHSVKV